jgi:hypothetical protein
MPNKTLTLAHTGKLKQEKRGVLLDGELKPTTAEERGQWMTGQRPSVLYYALEFIHRLIADHDRLEAEISRLKRELRFEDRRP